jgi:predicted phage-related endonuclease
MRAEIEEKKNWQDERRTGIGGSDVAACFNIERGCTRKLVYEKRGQVPDYPDLDKREMERGKALEDDAIEKYEREHGRQVHGRGELRRSEWHEFMLCHVDGLITPNKLGQGSQGLNEWRDGLLEVKTINKWALQRAKKGGLSESYILQMQHSFYVTGCSWGEWALLCPDPWELFVFKVLPDDELINKIIEREEEVWKMVTEGPLPDKLDPTDLRCQVCPFRRTCQGEAIQEALAPEDQDALVLETDLELDGAAQQVWEAKELVAQAKELEEEAVATMKAMIGHRDGVIVTGGRFILSKSWPQRWDAKALKASLKEMPFLKKFLKETPKDKPVLTLRTYRTGD